MDIFKIEYTIIASEENYKALVLGENENDCIAYLTKYVKGPVNVKFIDQISKVHGITDAIITRILDVYKNTIIDEYKAQLEASKTEDSNAKEFEPPHVNDLSDVQESKEKKIIKHKD